jgi:hypothetical protein
MPPSDADRARPNSLQPLHWLLGIQSLVIVLLSVNRLSELTHGPVLPNEFLRWVDLNNMLVLPLVSVVASYLVLRWLERQAPAAALSRELAVGVLFVVGVYLLAAGYGDHEVTNYLHVRFCSEAPIDEALCRIVVFNDDEFSHWVFFLGFVLVNGALLAQQALFPWNGPQRSRDSALLVGNALFIGAGVFANLAFEEIGLDLYVVALLALVSVWLLVRRGRQPLFLYYGAAYSLALVATALYKALGPR